MISVILPVRNMGNYLSNALACIVSQESVREVLVLDDCSNDDSLHVAQRYKSVCPVIRIERYPRKSENWLRDMLERVPDLKGDYVCFASADDLLYKGFFCECYKVLAVHSDIGAIFGNILALDIAGHIIGGTINNGCGYIAPHRASWQLCRGTEILPGPFNRRATFECACGSIVRRDVMLSLNDLWELGPLSDGTFMPIAVARHGGFYLDFFTAGNTNHPKQYSSGAKWPVDRAIKMLKDANISEEIVQGLGNKFRQTFG